MYLNLHSCRDIVPRELEFLTEEAKRNLDLNRNIFIQYKTFPDGKTAKTNTEWHTLQPQFSHKATFPVLLTDENVSKMKKFGFTFEVWDTLSPNKNQLIGFVRIACEVFSRAMVTEEGHFNTTFFKNESLYPSVAHDGLVEVKGLDGTGIGWLKLTLAFGSPGQVNRFVQMQEERE